jgi:hypothetical protein
MEIIVTVQNSRCTLLTKSESEVKRKKIIYKLGVLELEGMSRVIKDYPHFSMTYKMLGCVTKKIQYFLVEITIQIDYDNIFHDMLAFGMKYQYEMNALEEERKLLGESSFFNKYFPKQASIFG